MYGPTERLQSGARGCEPSCTLRLSSARNPQTLPSRAASPILPGPLTRWVRLRLRAALWRQWRTPRRRRAALLALGVRPRLADNAAGSGRGPWYLARAKALSVGLSNAYFKSLGLQTLIDAC